MKFLLMLSLLFGHLSFGASHCQDPLLVPGEILALQKTMRQIRHFKIIPFEHADGVFLIPDTERPEHEPTHSLILSSLSHSRDKWQYQIWQFRDKKYLLGDVGLRNLRTDTLEMNRLIVDHIRRHSDQGLKLYFGSNRKQDLLDFFSINSQLQKQVLERYQARKKLDEMDFVFLDKVNNTYVESETFFLSLIDNDRRQLTVSDLKKAAQNVSATIQAHYAGQGSVLWPNHETLIDTVLGAEQQTVRNHYFPFQQRVRGIFERIAIKQLVFNFLDLDKTAEITRYLIAENNLPEQINYRLILQIFETLKSRGVTTFLANADKKTSRLFTYKYGFRQLMEIPVHGGQIEYLVYLNVNSEEFRKTYEFLKEASRDVQVTHHIGFQGD